MAHKGHTGTSMGGGIVGRKQLKAQRTPDLPPVDPATLTPEARARREAYLAEQREREERARARAQMRNPRQLKDAEQLGRDGLRVVDTARPTRRRPAGG